MDQPVEFVVQANKNRVCKLQKKKKKLYMVSKKDLKNNMKI
jgi:hypothetical protein